MCRGYLGRASVMAILHSWWWGETTNCLGGIDQLPHYRKTFSAKAGHERFTLAAVSHYGPKVLSASCLSVKILIHDMQSVFSPSGKPAAFQASSWCSHFVHWEADWTLSLRGSEIMTALDFLFCTLNSVLAMIWDHAALWGFGRLWSIWF